MTALNDSSTQRRVAADQLAAVTICPVRHHSPAAALAVERQLLALKPRLILIEGPCDASDLIPLLLQPDTRPPVAILAYWPAVDGSEPRVMADPFCDYSPELVALRVGARLGSAVRFFDAPAALWLDRALVKEKAEAGEVLPDTVAADAFRALAERFGFATHDEFWDSSFEMAPVESVGELIAAYGDMVRQWCEEHGQSDLDRVRESWMLAELARALEEGYRPSEIAIVCGAAHVVGLRAGLIDDDLVARARGLAPARFALIPYSYLRLSEQSGYGAGNRAPAFYQEVWRRRGDWNATAADFLVRLVHEMRERGYALSLADTIEAQRLALNLAGLRGKSAVGLEELGDAAQSCYGRGSYHPAPFLEKLLVGDEVGMVSAMATKTALQQDFHDQVKRCGLPFSDSPRELRLNLTSPAERASSAFLHRLEVIGVPFARLARTGSANLNVRSDEGDDSIERLMVLREKWELRWSPATDIRLIELSAQGNSVAEVCQRKLRGQLAAARGMQEVTEVLRQVVLGRLDTLHDEVMSICERVSSEDDDFASLSRASYALEIVSTYGDARGLAELLPRLAERVFARACLLLPGAAIAADEEAARVAEGLKSLNQVATRRRQRGQDVSLFLERLNRTTASADAHPSIVGLVGAILYLEGELSDDDLTGALNRRLSRGEEPLRAAQFVEGLFSLNRSVLVRNRAVVASLTAFLTEVEKESYLAILPVLRRSLASLTPPEMGYLVTTIASVLEIDRETAEKSSLEAGQLDELAALDGEIGDLFN